MFGSLHLERLRKTAAEADAVEMTNAITRREFLSAKDLTGTFAEVARTMVQIVRGSALSRREQDDLLLQLSSLKVEVARQGVELTGARRLGPLLDRRRSAEPRKRPATVSLQRACV